jgi:hypothetical protein
MRAPELPESWPHIELVSPMLAPQAHLYPWLIACMSFHLRVENIYGRPFTVCRSNFTADCPLYCPVHVRLRLYVICWLMLFLRDASQRGHISALLRSASVFHLHWMLSPWQLFNQLPAQEIPYWTFWLEGEWHTLAFPARVSCLPGDQNRNCCWRNYNVVGR